MNGEKSIDTKLKKGHTYLVKTKFGEPEEFGVWSLELNLFRISSVRHASAFPQSQNNYINFSIIKISSHFITSK